MPTTIMSRRGWFAVAVALILAIATTLVLVTSNDSQAGPAPSAALEKAQALASAPDLPVEILPEDETVQPADARAVAQRISEAEIPLPPGLNSAASLDWSKQSEGFGGGAMAESEIRRTLQFNANRDWLWFAAHNPLTDDQRKILDTMLDWPALRGAKDRWSKILDEILTGKTSNATAGQKQRAADLAAFRFRRTGGKPPARTGW